MRTKFRTSNQRTQTTQLDSISSFPYNPQLQFNWQNLHIRFFNQEQPDCREQNERFWMFFFYHVVQFAGREQFLWSHGLAHWWINRTVFSRAKFVKHAGCLVADSPSQKPAIGSYFYLPSFYETTPWMGYLRFSCIRGWRRNLLPNWRLFLQVVTAFKQRLDFLERIHANSRAQHSQPGKEVTTLTNSSSLHHSTEHFLFIYQDFHPTGLVSGVR